MSRPKFILAGGGTGGHVFPAIAVAEALQALADVEIVFCGTVRGVEARVVPERGWPLELFDIEPIKGKTAARAVRAAVVAGQATLRALSLIGRLRPRTVLSVGGYASGPVALAAALRGIPLAVLEPNRVVGLSNRLVAPFAKRAYLAWDEAGACFRPRARRAYGVPLRHGFTPHPYAPRGTARILVMGGSQGAAVFNERIPDAIARLGASVPGLEIVHQTGPDRDALVRASYARGSVAHVRVVAFLRDVAAEIAAADIVVARAGAGAIAEITAIGRASVLVPLPHSADDHQGRNAESLDQVGAAVCVRQEVADAPRLATEIARLLGDDSARIRMADAARARGKPNAAHDVAADLLRLAGVDARPQSANGGPTRIRRALDEAR
jgi:UDP-N-acetylglucosamine--N-acetylmuramyl-(pentapeptide) pyrophosphoryl-undecaprenol N-acetylglucosamine transferase